jgi:hypothetical protein
MLLDIEFARGQKSCLGSWASVTILHEDNKSEKIYIPRGYSHIIEKIQSVETNRNQTDYDALLRTLGGISFLRNKAGRGIFAKRSDGIDAVYKLLETISTQIIQGTCNISKVREEMERIRRNYNGNNDWNPSFEKTLNKLKTLNVIDVASYKKLR